MATQDLLTGRTTASDSTAIVCDGDKVVTLGLYAGAGLATQEPFSERAGCGVFQTDGTRVIGPLLDECGKHVTLTARRPVVWIHHAGNYIVRKGVTSQKIGVWGETGA